MRGLYLNTSLEKIDHHFEEVNRYSKLFKDIHYSNEVTIKYDPNEWSNEPVLTLQDVKWYCYGWFIYKNKKNEFDELVADFEAFGVEAFANITAGAFVLLRLSPNSADVFSDALGLSCHYARRSTEKLEVSPSLNCFVNKKKASIFESILNKNGKLFGNYTAYENIERLEPGAKTNTSVCEKFYTPNFKSEMPLEQVFGQISKLVSFWDEKYRSVAISGGLDSRLILASGKFQYGYTYGPESTGDRPVARQFSDEFEKYDEYSFLAPPKLKEENDVCKQMFEGASSWAYRLYSAYAYARQCSPSTYVFYDGYLGGVLQRGAYLKFSGMLGEIFKVLPFLYSLNIFTAKDLLKKRYSTLNDDELNILMDDFDKHTKDLRTDDEFAKLTYYEFVYGKGARYVINGGNLTCGQFFTVVPVFTELNVFHSFISQSMISGVQFKFLADVWRKVPVKFKEVKTETGFKPHWSPRVIPLVDFYNRLKLHFLPGGNYGREYEESKKKGL